MSGIDPDDGPNVGPNAVPDPDPDEPGVHQSVPRRLLNGLKENKLALFGAFVIVLLAFTAVFAPLIAPHEPEDTYGIMKSPNSESVGDYDADGEVEEIWHPLGTDSFGHDVFTRIVYGSRISLLVALATIVVAFSVGTTIGLVAGFYGGWIDSLLMRYIDFQWAFPEIILAVGLIAVTGGTGVWNVVIAIGIAFIDDFARLVRGEILSIREEEYVMAARAVGMSDRRLLVREVLPNAVAPLIVQATFMIPLAILAEASLSFLGLGVSPTTPTWGLLVSEGRNFLLRAWWISVMPGLAIMVSVLAFNMIGDGLRDMFDVTDTEEVQQA